MKPITELKRLDEILKPYKDAMGNDYSGYRNHALRVLNFCFYLAAPSEDDQEKLIIAAAFHDIGLWTAGTIDYIDPSAEEARQYLVGQGKEDWIEEVMLMITEHHKVTALVEERFPLAETFRKADLVDFSMGLVRHGVERDFIKSVRSSIPNAGFHKTLMRFTWQQAKSKPWNLFPMMKW